MCFYFISLALILYDDIDMLLGKYYVLFYYGTYCDDIMADGRHKVVPHACFIYMMIILVKVFLIMSYLFIFYYMGDTSLMQ